MLDQNIKLNKINKVYFVGIGGIGISASARILKDLGKIVVGSDASESEITKQLASEGIKVFIGQKAENIAADFDLAVYTVAAPEDNPERQKIKELGISQISYPELLGLLLQEKYGIGVSGTDGKTTTTAMLGQILIEAKLDPTILVGSKVAYLGGNSRVGQSDYFVFESDEYKRAFINYFPKIAIITNIAEDHLDYYHDLADIKSAFSEYIGHLPEDGFLIFNLDDENAEELAQKAKAQKISFGIKQEATVMAKNIRMENSCQIFELEYQGKILGELALPLPAEYNIYNALGAIAAALALKVDFETIKKAIGEFKGAWRRFERLGQIGQAEVITDYAHTPYAVKKTIEAMKSFFADKKVFFVFQPHQYARTKKLFEEFVASFSQADEIIISDIFYVKGREKPEDFDVDSRKLVEAASKLKNNISYGGDLANTEKIIREKAKDFDVIMLMGAGDIYDIAKELVKK